MPISPPIPTPVAVRTPPVITITLDAAHRVHITSNIEPGPASWPMIVQLLHAALGLACQQLAQQATGQTAPVSRIIVPDSGRLH